MNCPWRCWIARAAERQVAEPCLTLWPTLGDQSSAVLWDNPGEPTSACGVLAGDESGSQGPPRSVAQQDEAGLDGTCLESHHLSNARAWWRGTFVVPTCGLGAEPGGCSPRNMSRSSSFSAPKESAFEICLSFSVNSWLQ